MSGKNYTMWLATLPLVLAISGARPPQASPLPQLKIESAVAYKYAGQQPIDVEVRVVDDRGAPVDDASVATTYGGIGTNILLKGIGKGYYLGCDIGTSSGTTMLAVAAKKLGMLPATTKVKTQPGNLCGEGESQLIVSAPVAAKPDGKKQPLDIHVDVRDEAGNPVEGAKVMARATDFLNYVDAPLTDVGNGRYEACDFGFFSGAGEGAVSIHIRADEAGYTPGANDGQSSVGRLCTLP